MALNSPVLLHRFSTFPSLRKFFFSPSSIPLNSQLPLLSPISSTSSSSALTTHLHSKDTEKIQPEEEEQEDVILSEQINVLLPSFPTPKLTIKEKKDLASYANSLGKKLKSQQVGKSGVIPAVAAAMVEALEANELLKLKVHGSCPGELSDVVKQLENATGSTAVSLIGRTVILYRPSLTKMKKKDSDESRKQQQTLPAKSATVLKATKKKQVTRTLS